MQELENGAAFWERVTEEALRQTEDESGLPLRLYGGAWAKPAGHLQGAAVDDERRYLYLSFTDRLLKVEMRTGRVAASVTGLKAGGIYGGGAHLGDLAFYQGKVYGSLEYKAAEKFYIAVFDPERMTALDIDYRTPGVMNAMYLAEVVRDYCDELDAGEHDNAPASMGHRFGCSGIDGVTFGPIPGERDGGDYLLVAYGVYRNALRQDNDYQVLLAYRIEDFAGAPLDQNAPHTVGPRLARKLFVYTGNTSYGVQNLEYDQETGDLWMIVYRGDKEAFPNYPVYLVDGACAPRLETLRVAGKAYGDMRGECLRLKAAGALHAPSGVYGLPEMPGRADTGFISLGGGRFYVAVSGKREDGRQTGGVKLMRLDRGNYTFTDAK